MNTSVSFETLELDDHGTVIDGLRNLTHAAPQETAERFPDHNTQAGPPPASSPASRG